MGDLAVILTIGVISYGLRVSFIAVIGDRSFPAGASRLLDALKPAALAALTVTALVRHGDVMPSHLLATGVAGVVAYRRGSLSMVLICGMLAHWTANALL